MGHFSMEIGAPTGSNLSGNQHMIATEELGIQQSTFKAYAELPAFPWFSN
jgi:hypothetical protein